MNRKLLATIISIMVLAVFFVPYLAFAGSIVPECSGYDELGNFTGACTLCDLVVLAQNLINFAVGFTTIVAALMFTYAGILYFTASAKVENIKKAHDIFAKVFAGLVIILSAWLIINVVMSVLYKESVLRRPWQTINCRDYALSTELATQGPTIVGTREAPLESCRGTDGRSSSAAQEQAVRGRLAQKNVCVSASGSTQCDVPACREGQTSGCTSVGGLTTRTVDYILRVADAYPNCSLVVTGGSEAGHCTHNTGEAFDLRTNCALLNQSYSNLENGISTDGAWWYRESDHWHVCVAGRSGCE